MGSRELCYKLKNVVGKCLEFERCLDNDDSNVKGFRQKLLRIFSRSDDGNKKNNHNNTKNYYYRAMINYLNFSLKLIGQILTNLHFDDVETQKQVCSSMQNIITQKKYKNGKSFVEVLDRVLLDSGIEEGDFIEEINFLSKQKDIQNNKDINDCFDVANTSKIKDKIKGKTKTGIDKGEMDEGFVACDISADNTNDNFERKVDNESKEDVMSEFKFRFYAFARILNLNSEEYNQIYVAVRQGLCDQNQVCLDNVLNDKSVLKNFVSSSEKRMKNSTKGNSTQDLLK